MKKLFKALYESEINLSIDWLWDSGIRVKIGDEMNGFVSENLFDIEEIDKIENWIENEVKEHFPNSKFSKTYNNDEFESAVEPAIRYLLNNHNPHSAIHINYDIAVLYSGEKCHNLTNEVPD